MANRDPSYGDDGASEQTPLVAGDSARFEPLRRPAHRTMLSVASITSIASHLHVPKAHNGKTIVFLLCIVLFVSSCANGFVQIPMTKVVENVVCHQHYGQVQDLNKEIDEPLCKIPAIQSRMAYIFAIVEVTEAVAGFVAAFPWGIAADRLGRKPVFVMSLIGLAMSIIWFMTVLWFDTVFNPTMIALSCLFRFVGGGNAVLIGILLSMISDVVPEDQRATAFMWTHVASLVGGQISPALSSAMMSATGPWPVMWVGVACVLAGAIVFMFVPETLQHKHVNVDEDGEQQLNGFNAHMHHILNQIKDSIAILKSNSLILLMLTCLFTYPIAGSLGQFLVQFISKRYAISIQSTGYVQTSYGLAQIVVALALLPWLSRFMLQDEAPKLLRMANEQARDLLLARASFTVVFLGFVILAVAPMLWMFVFGLLVLAVGSAGTSLIRSLLSLYVDPEHRSRLYSMVGMVEVISNVYGPPMLAGMFSLGMKIGEPWVGLPYFGIAALAASVIVLLLLVRVPKQSEETPLSYEEARVHQD